MTNYLAFKMGEVTVGLKFGLPAVRRISEANEKYEVTDDRGIYNTLGAAHIFYAGYLNNCLIKEIDPTMTLVEFVDYVETAFVIREDEPADWQNVLEGVKFFAASFVVKSMVEKAKKKITIQQTDPTQIPGESTSQTGTESNPSATGSSG
jgi:hypothetical protein